MLSEIEVKSSLFMSPSTLPIIDIAPFLRDDQPELRASTSAALHAACVKYGFFYLDISAFADSSETKELTELAREFFALPQGEKDKISLSNEDHARGEFYEPPLPYRLNSSVVGRLC